MFSSLGITFFWAAAQERSNAGLQVSSNSTNVGKKKRNNTNYYNILIFIKFIEYEPDLIPTRFNSELN